MSVWPTDTEAARKKASCKVFPTPEKAVEALIAALQSGNSRQISTILCPGSIKLLSSGNAAEDDENREKFLANYAEKHVVEAVTSKKAVLRVGNNDWPFSIPIVQKANGWTFDIREGRREIAVRKIGRNELNVIKVMQAYVDAQLEYASKDRDGDGVFEFAQKIVSQEGEQDGLFWEKNGSEESPFGPLISDYRMKTGKSVKSGKSVPYHGYYYRILTGQGGNVSGGEYSYIVKENMILGFALIAWPADFGKSGVMTFMVNQQGIIYQKNLGRNTAKIVSGIKLYNPDQTWEKVEIQDPAEKKN